MLRPSTSCRWRAAMRNAEVMSLASVLVAQTLQPAGARQKGGGSSGVGGSGCAGGGSGSMGRTDRGGTWMVWPQAVVQMQVPSDCESVMTAGSVRHDSIRVHLYDTCQDPTYPISLAAQWVSGSAVASPCLCRTSDGHVRPRVGTCSSCAAAAEVRPGSRSRRPCRAHVRRGCRGWPAGRRPAGRRDRPPV